MSLENVIKLIDRWIEDSEFRAALRRDSEAAVKSMGVDLTEEEWEVFRTIDWTLSDEELQKRISRGMFT